MSYYQLLKKDAVLCSIIALCCQQFGPTIMLLSCPRFDGSITRNTDGVNKMELLDARTNGEYSNHCVPNE